jgi:hypothetical protein
MSIDDPTSAMLLLTRRRKESVDVISNLLLVPGGRFYRPALRISERPDLAAAFARGEEMRAAGPVAPDDAHTEWLVGLSSDERTAYMLGRHGASALRAPAPAPVVVPLLLAQALSESLLGERRSRPAKVAIFLAMVAVAWGTALLTDRAERRRAQRLGLTVETAPVAPPAAVMSGQVLVRTLLVGIQRLRSRRVTGRWPRVDPASTVAAGAIYELQRRRDWNAAYRARLTASEP